VLRSPPGGKIKRPKGEATHKTTMMNGKKAPPLSPIIRERRFSHRAAFLGCLLTCVVLTSLPLFSTSRITSVLNYEDTPTEPKPLQRSLETSSSDKTPVIAEAINCGCPDTCDSAALGQTKWTRISCEARIEYLMSTYGSSQMKACSIAVQKGACGDQCDPSRCLKGDVKVESNHAQQFSEGETAWNPRLFDNTTNNIARGSNFITAVSGCSFTTWAMESKSVPRKARDCEGISKSRKLEKHVHKIRTNDTVYVPTRALPEFVEKYLPYIAEPFVLISGQYHHRKAGNRVKLGAVNAILNHSKVIRWFCQNPDMYTHLKQPHPKLSSFPYGIQHKPYTLRDENPLEAFRQAYNRHIILPTNKSGLLQGYISPQTSKLRRNIPSGPKLARPEFYDRLAASSFVLSPHGDRPDCYRTYEALALGTVPITGLDPAWYTHFTNSSVIFDTTNWNLTETDAQKQVGVAKVNRNMIFEEYWLEYVERTVGHPLHWWDRRTNAASLLMDFTVNYDLVEQLVNVSEVSLS